MSWLERRAAWIAFGLAILHAGLALAYAAATPYLTPGRSNGLDLPDIGAPDEAAHVHYVAAIASGEGLPVLIPTEARGHPVYENHQPPLYYLLAAGWAKAFGAEPLQRSSRHAIRSLNGLVGIGTVLGVYFFCFWTTGRPATALFAAAFAGLLPMLAALDGAVSNDPLTFCLCTWTLALLVRWKDDWNVPRSIAVGLLIGAAFWTKATGLLLLPPFLVSVWRSNPGRRLPVGTAGILAAAVLIAPWVVRNLAVYGDPLGMSAFYATFTRDVFPAEVFSGVRPLIHWLYVLTAGTALSFIGIFGYMDIHLSYALYIPILILVGLGLLATVRRSNDLALRLPIGAFVILLVASFVAYNLWQVQPQARYLFPAIAPIALWVGLGWERIAGARASIVLGALLILLGVANASALLRLPADFQVRTQAATPRWAK